MGKITKQQKQSYKGSYISLCRTRWCQLLQLSTSNNPHESFLLLLFVVFFACCVFENFYLIIVTVKKMTEQIHESCSLFLDLVHGLKDNTKISHFDRHTNTR